MTPIYDLELKEHDQKVIYIYQAVEGNACTKFDSNPIRHCEVMHWAQCVKYILTDSYKRDVPATMKGPLPPERGSHHEGKCFPVSTFVFHYW